MEDFKQMTFRTLYHAMEMIRIRKHNDFVKSASLQGIKLEMKQAKRSFEPISDKIKEKMITIHQEAMKRKVAEKRKKRSRR